MIGLNIKNVKTTNHSAQSTAVSHLAKAGINKQEINDFDCNVKK